MPLAHKKVTVRVPATTANFGPAYDIMGMAMDLWLEVTVEAADAFSLTMTGQGADLISCGEDNMVVQCCREAFRRCGSEMPPLKFTLQNDVPFGAGCGSSSAAAIAGALSAFVLLDHRLRLAGAEEMLQIATDIEGHPDNAAPAIYGGIQISLRHAGRVQTNRVPTPPAMWVVLFVPHKQMKAHTNETRKLIPTEVSMEDAVHNMARTALLVLGLAQGDLTALRPCADDRFHQMQRKGLFPHMCPVVDAAFAAGAGYACLSGAGPTVAAFVAGRHGEEALLPSEERHGDAVGRAMVAAAKAAGVEGRYYATRPTDRGAHVVSVE